jgi:hypothetical protein
MKIFRGIMTALAWIGVVLIIIGVWNIAGMTILDLTWTQDQIRIQSPNPGWSYFFLGVMLSSIGGLIGRPRFIWPLLFSLGAICCILVIIDAIAEQNYFHESILNNLLMKMPTGIVCVIVGLIIRWLRMRQNTRARIQVSQ